MPNVINQSMLDRYLTELAKDEAKITEAAEVFEAAKAEIDVGLRRYVALREFVEQQLGTSPYAPTVSWPTVDGNYRTGRFRFTNMPVGDAVLQVLEEKGNAWGLTLQDIIRELSEGGLGFPEPVQARSVNAALLKTTGITRGKGQGGEVAYWLSKPSDDEQDLEPEDLPF